MKSPYDMTPEEKAAEDAARQAEAAKIIAAIRAAKGSPVATVKRRWRYSNSNFGMGL